MLLLEHTMQVSESEPASCQYTFSSTSSYYVFVCLLFLLISLLLNITLALYLG